jgi:large subunit ribosomal protein L54
MTCKNLSPLVQIRVFAMAKRKKGGKGSGASDAPKDSISNELKSTTVVGANSQRRRWSQGTLENKYPDLLWGLLDKRPPLSELRRKDVESLPFEDLKRLVKLDNHSRIKENNAFKAKNWIGLFFLLLSFVAFLFQVNSALEVMIAGCYSVVYKQR